MQTLAIELKNIPSWAKNSCLIIGASLLMGLFAHISIPLPFTPVPLVTQNTLILLFSVLLGSKRAPAAVALFLTQGALGLPVFANGATGLEKLWGPTGGYLIGYLFVAYAVGKIVELLKKRTLWTALIAMVTGNVLLLAIGTLWLSTFVGGMKNGFLLGFAPFILGDLFKIGLSLKILHWKGWRVSNVEVS